MSIMGVNVVHISGVSELLISAFTLGDPMTASKRPEGSHDLLTVFVVEVTTL